MPWWPSKERELEPALPFSPIQYGPKRQKPGRGRNAKHVEHPECQTDHNAKCPKCQMPGMLLPGMPKVRNAEHELYYRFLCTLWYFMHSGTQGPPTFCRWNCIVLMNSENSFFCHRWRLVLISGFLTQKCIANQNTEVAPVCHYIYA